MTAFCHSVKPTVFDLCDQPMPSQLADQPGHTRATSSLFLNPAQEIRVQTQSQIAIPETVEEMLPCHHCLEQPSLLGPHWIELGEALPVDYATPAQEVQLVDRLTFCFYLRQGFQVAGVGLLRYLGVAPKIRHALAHR